MTFVILRTSSVCHLDACLHLASIILALWSDRKAALFASLLGFIN